MKLYDLKVAANPRRVRIFLAEKGIEVETVQVDLRGADNLKQEFTDMNPFGRVPVLELDDGSYLSESVAICRYFEELNPEPALFGSGARERARVEMWQRRAELSFLLPVGFAFRHLTGFFKDRETVCPDWGEAMADEAARVLPIFDRHLQSSEYLAGERFSIADITFTVALDFARASKRELPADLSGVSRWHEQVAARPSYRA